jgi:hypothetical protein
LTPNSAGKFDTWLDFQLPRNSPMWVTTAVSANFGNREK